MANKPPPPPTRKKSKGFLDLFMDEFRDIIMPVPDVVMDDWLKRKKTKSAVKDKKKK